MKETKGITMISIVITIIVMLILVGITINFVIGENSIILKTKESRDEKQLAEIDEKQKLHEYENQLKSKQKNRLYIKTNVIQDFNYDYASIKIQCRIGGIPEYKTYEEYSNAREILKNKTEEEKINLVLITEKNNHATYYENKYPGQEVTWDMIYAAYSATNLEELLKNNSAENIDELLIKWRFHKKAEYSEYYKNYRTQYLRTIKLTLPDGTIKTTNNISTVVYNVIDNDKYKFIAEYEEQVEEQNVEVSLIRKKNEYEIGKINENQYKIEYIEDLIALALNVKNGYTYKNKTFLLLKTLDFNDVNSYRNPNDVKTFGDYNKDGILENIKTEVTKGCGFTPIGLVEYKEDIKGDVEKRFNGSFNGNNYEIKNVYIDYHDSYTIGLFGLSYGIISNLNIDGNYNINNDMNYYVGGCAAYNQGIIENVTCNVNINDKDLNNTTNEIYMYGYIGGVCGYNAYGKLIDCTNKSSIKYKHNIEYVGGVCGYSSANTTVTRCKNIGEKIEVDNAYSVAGVCGAFLNGPMSECYNIADFNCTDSKIVGGVIGFNDTIKAVFNRCYNTGDFNINNPNYVGGVIGSAPNSILMFNSFNTGNLNVVSEIKSRIGGITGYQRYGLIANVYNTGNVMFEGDTVNGQGGIVGDGTSGARNANSYNTGKQYAQATKVTVGGVNGVTYHSSNMLSNYNFGIIEIINAPTNNVGAIAGGSYGTIKNTKYLEGTWTRGVGNRSDGVGIAESCTMEVLPEMLNDLNQEKRKVGDYTIPDDIVYDKWEIRPGVNNGFPVFTWQ